MNSQRQYHRGKFLLCGILLLLLCVYGNVAIHATEHSEGSEAASSAEYLEVFMLEGDESFERQDFWTAYEGYKRVLELDPGYEIARKNVYEIAKIYKTLEEVAKQEQDTEKAEMFYQQRQSIVRELLGVLTTQLKRTISTYNQAKKRKEQGKDAQEKIVLALDDTLTVLHELKAVYEQFPRDETSTTQMVEKIDAAIAKYMKERTQYHK